MISTNERTDLVAPGFRRRPDRVVIQRAVERSAIETTLGAEMAADHPRLAPIVCNPADFAQHLAAEYDRYLRGGRDCVVASMSLFEIPSVKLRLAMPISTISSST